ncbi:MAG: amidohydrolase family protein [Planctomycetota bacterium]|jgi:imidazolonepropionase-like amidohydrolase|nr:amidohydrolase family protein [Planctomycetota bacterium]
MSGRHWLGACALAAGIVLALAREAEALHDHPIELDGHREPSLKTGGSCVITGATVHSAVGPAFEADVLVVEGRIEAVGEVTTPEGFVVIDGTGGHLVPGAVDCHSHMAIERGINEGSVSISAEVTMRDVVNSDDMTIYRALAGGTTTARLLHGSANAIGGQDAVIKMRWGRRAGELLMEEAPVGIKFALGENPKRSRGGRNTSRFPASRMGVEAVFARAFDRAREYAADWEVYDAARAAGEDALPPRRDLRLDALRGILERRIHVHCHCYRADEILMIIRTAQRYGFHLATLQHVLEGYKVAREMAEAGVGGSTFSDWWAYKIEAYDAIPHNAAMMDRAGVLSSVNSDSDDLVRRLFCEAAKSVGHAGLDPVRALALVTINPARQLGLEDRVGSIEVGKDADLVLMNGPPLSSLSRVRWTMVEGEIEFERRDAFGLDDAPLAPHPVEAAEAEPAVWNEAGGEAIAITGATIHPASSPAIEGGTILIQDARILAVGTEVSLPAAARVIDGTGRHVWPGMIALNTDVGLREIGAIAATMDISEIGGNQPDLRVSASIHAASAHIGVTRSGGISRCQTAPQGGGPIMGRSAVIDLDGDTWEELVSVDADMLHIRFPRVANDADLTEEHEDITALRELFAQARRHADLTEQAQASGAPPPPGDRRLEALAPYARGSGRVALHATNAQTILGALRFATEEELDAVLFGATEGWKVAGDIASSGVDVVVGPVLSIPRSRFDPYDSAYANPAVLHRSGIRVALMADDPQNTRNLAHHAAMAVAFGLPREEALRAVSLYPARILGLDDRLGSLEPGKTADLLVTDGDLLEITSRVEYLFVDGRQVDLANKQTRLRDRYQARLEGE